MVMQPKGKREYVYSVLYGRVREYVLVRENGLSFLVKDERLSDTNINRKKEGFYWWHSRQFEDQFITTRNKTTAVLFAKFQCRFCGFKFKDVLSRHRQSE